MTPSFLAIVSFQELSREHYGFVFWRQSVCVFQQEMEGVQVVLPEAGVPEKEVATPRRNNRATIRAKHRYRKRMLELPQNPHVPTEN